MPITGFHSVIDSPDSVSRVTPPTTIIRKIIPQQAKSHAATARGALFGFAAPAALGNCVTLDRTVTSPG